MDKVADALGQKPPAKWTRELARQSIFGDAARKVFADGNARRLAKFAQTLSADELGSGVAMGKAAKIGLAIALIDLAFTAKGALAMDSTPEFAELMVAYENALQWELDHGYPKGELVVQTLLKLETLVRAIGADNTQFWFVYDAYLKKARTIEPY